MGLKGLSSGSLGKSILYFTAKFSVIYWQCSAGFILWCMHLYCVILMMKFVTNDKENHERWNRFDSWSLLEFAWFQLTATSIGSDNVLAPTRRQSHCLNGWCFCLLTRVWVSEVQWVKRVLLKSNTTVVLKRAYVPREPDKTIAILLSSLKTYVLHRYAFRWYSHRIPFEIVSICHCVGVINIRAFCTAGPRLNIKTVLSMYGDFHVKDKTAVRTSYL